VSWLSAFRRGTGAAWCLGALPWRLCGSFIGRGVRGRARARDPRAIAFALADEARQDRTAMVTRRLSVPLLVPLLGITVVVLAIASPMLLRAGAERALRAAGFAQGAVASAAIAPDGIHLAGIRSDPAGGVRVDEVVIPWSLGLLSGGVDRATLVGAHVVIDTRGAGGNGPIAWGPVPHVSLALRGVVLELRTAAGVALLAFDATAAPDAAGRLRFAGQGTIRRAADPAFVVPLAAMVALDWTAEGLAVRARLTDAASGLDLAIAGGVQPAAGSGELQLTGAPVQLSAQRPPAAISPVLARALAVLMRDVAGRVALEARVAWRAGARTASARVRLDDVGFASDAGTVVGLSGTLAFAGLDPPRLDGAQRLRVGRVEAGLALRDLDVELRQNAAGTLVVQRASAAALGGRIEAGPIAVSLARQHTTVRFRDVAVADMLALGGLAGLSGSGRLAGQLAVQITPDRVVLERGELAATGPGRLAYAPANPGSLGEQAATLLAVLSDFRYERLAITFERVGERSGEADRAIRDNPALFGVPSGASR
jgi:hypothetical protein